MLAPSTVTPYAIPSRCGNADVSCQVKDPDNRWVCSRCPLWATLSGQVVEDAIS